MRFALRAADEATAQDASAVALVAIEDAGLAGRYAGFAVDQFDPDATARMMEHRRLRRTGRADLGADLQAAFG